MQQWIRQCTLLISGGGSALDVSQMRIVFTVKKTQNETPNQAQIRVYNLSTTTENQIVHEGQRVTLQAGYKENFGVIFDGDIIQVKKGRENGVETYVEIIASDGDKAYNFSVINTTLSAGSTQADHVNVANNAMGLGKSQIDSGGQPLPRGKVIFGNARDVLRQTAQSNNQNWSIQNGQLQMIAKNGLLSGQAIYLNSKSGLIGGAEQSNNGIKAKALLNPMIKIGGAVIIDEIDVQYAKIKAPKPPKKHKSEEDPSKPVNKPAEISKDGAYKVIEVEYKGDTYGSDWYSEVICIDIQAVQNGTEG
ncbi:MAG TPA: hypothetical protein VFM18_22205 [Methanosarcina sp.]|nr:hypothetical protein [Methanosarcina sp.]